MNTELETRETGTTLKPSPLLTLAAQIVTAQITSNPASVETTELPGVIRQVYETLADLSVETSRVVPGQTTSAQTETSASAPTNFHEPLRPAVPVKKSITDDYIICLEDGKKLKMLKRHLKSAYDMTPEEYRAKWNLSPNYPMVAPNYAQKRRELAKQIGLGRRTVERDLTNETAGEGEAPKAQTAAKGKGRGKQTEKQTEAAA